MCVEGEAFALYQGIRLRARRCFGEVGLKIGKYDLEAPLIDLKSNIYCFFKGWWHQMAFILHTTLTVLLIIFVK